MELSRDSEPVVATSTIEFAFEIASAALLYKGRTAATTATNLWLCGSPQVMAKRAFIHEIIVVVLVFVPWTGITLYP